MAQALSSAGHKKIREFADEQDIEASDLAVDILINEYNKHNPPGTVKKEAQDANDE